MIDLYFYELEPKAYLNLYKAYRWRIENREADIKEIEGEATRYGIKLDGLPKSGRINHPTEEAAFKLLKQRTKYEDEIKKCRQIREDIKDTIQAVPDPMLEKILTMRYIKQKRWPEISKAVYYNRSYVEKELHRKALDLVQIEMRRKAARVIEAYKGGDSRDG